MTFLETLNLFMWFMSGGFIVGLTWSIFFYWVNWKK